MHVDQAEEICRLLDLKDLAADKLKSLEPGSDGYQDALKAVVDLSKAIDVAEKRYFEEDLERKRFDTEIKKIKADREESKRQFEESMDRRKKEFIANTAIGVAGGVAKGAMVMGMNNMEYGGKLYLTTKQSQNFVRDFLHLPPKRK